MEPDTLESWINRATNPLNKDLDWDSINAFCEQLNKELEGPPLATRLLAHKIQSPQEWEAIQALTVLETCMKNCGKRFHDEVGKFRFLNELIKVVSPKYLGSRTPEKVKLKILELMYSWTLGLPQEVKITEAYQMLKKQGIVKCDPKLPDEAPLPLPPPRPKNIIFDDEEKSKMLARLLKSSHSEDLRAANKLIKEMVQEMSFEGGSRSVPAIVAVPVPTCGEGGRQTPLTHLHLPLQDQKRMEKISKRTNAIEEVNNNVKLLTEMVTSYSKGETTESSEDLMKELYQRCERMRPMLFRLASDTEDNDEALAEILQANDNLTQVINLYKQFVRGEEINGETVAGPLQGLNDPSPQAVDSSGWNSFQDSSEPSLPSIPAAPARRAEAGTPAPGPSPVTSGLDDLDLLGKTLLQQSLPPESQQVRWEKQPPPRLTLRDLQNKTSSGTSVAATSGTPTLLRSISSSPSAPLPPPLEQPAPATLPRTTPTPAGAMPPPLGLPTPTSPQEISLANITVPLESIKPSSILPVTVYDQHGFRVLFHFARDSLPERPDMLVVVISMLSTAPLPIRNIVFQSAVPKVMKVKLQPPSGTELPAFNPIVHPTAITQVLLLANPQKEKVRLRYKLTFTMGEQTYNEMGDVDQFPPPESWGSL
ncbi:ADP-ribosylation factor-binding protein GGA1 isoform X3 [Chelonia mydas]|uniref:ADP-ribosylation factor-binding protein GGA1 isoform X3 n=1 Tax=Chelonia mydas TaxID=8469 RepID=UPI0018A21C15|nr:ADP-ribosylation factor-binding protein GGA1 isoform X3 [Chelonia mydas]